MKRTLLLALLAPLIAIADAGVALKDDTLRREPYAEAAATGTLKRNDKLNILEKKGAWVRVKSAGSSGWVRLLSVKRGSGGSNRNEVAGVLSVASGRAGTGQVVSTTGVRGLNEEELKAAKFDEPQVKQLESYTVSAGEAQKFAAAGGLRAIKLAYLPAPASTGGSRQ